MLLLVFLIVLSGVARGDVPLDLDCTHPVAAKELIGRIRLSEIEWAEDVQREALWNAFGQCAEQPGAEACRKAAQARFAADWARQKAAIDAKYQQMERDFEERCQASVA